MQTWPRYREDGDAEEEPACDEPAVRSFVVDPRAPRLSGTRVAGSTAGRSRRCVGELLAAAPAAGSLVVVERERAACIVLSKV